MKLRLLDRHDQFMGESELGDDVTWRTGIDSKSNVETIDVVAVHAGYLRHVLLVDEEGHVLQKGKARAGLDQTQVGQIVRFPPGAISIEG